MNNTSLDLFVGNVLARKRIRFGDLRRLQRDILPSGPTTRGEVKVLIALDQAVEKADPTWARYLTKVVTEFVVVDGGSVDQDAAVWLVSVLSCARPKTAAAIVREVLVAADQVDDALLAFSEGCRRRSRPETPSSEPIQLGLMQRCCRANLLRPEPCLAHRDQPLFPEEPDPVAAALTPQN